MEQKKSDSSPHDTGAGGGLTNNSPAGVTRQARWRVLSIAERFGGRDRSLVSPDGRTGSIEGRQVEAVFDGQSARGRVNEMFDRVNRVTLGPIRRRDDADAVQAVPADVVETLADRDRVKRRIGFEGGDGLVCAGGVAHFEDVSGRHEHAEDLERWESHPAI